MSSMEVSAGLRESSLRLCAFAMSVDVCASLCHSGPDALVHPLGYFKVEDFSPLNPLANSLK